MTPNDWPAPSREPHLYKVQINDEDLDPLYHVVRWDVPRRWYREAHEDFFRSRRLDLATLRQHGFVFMPERDETSFRRPIFPRDRVGNPVEPMVLTRLDGIQTHMHDTEMHYRQEIRVGGEIAVRSKLLIAVLYKGKSAVLPAGIRARLEG